MSTDSESTRIARAILAVLLAGVAISFAVVGYLAMAGDGTRPAVSTGSERPVPLVRADRNPVRLPPG